MKTPKGRVFTTTSVQAILAGQMRVIHLPMKVQPPAPTSWPPFLLPAVTPDRAGRWQWYDDHRPGAAPVFHARCPYGRSGDQIWVRETWQVEGIGPLSGRWFLLEYDKPSVIRARWERVDLRVKYAADAADGDVNKGPWRPSTQMPQWASRLTLGVRRIRPMRLHEVTEAGALDGGYPSLYTFRQSWIAANDHGQDHWDTNPWIWSVGFDVVSSNVNITKTGNEGEE